MYIYIYICSVSHFLNAQIEKVEKEPMVEGPRYQRTKLVKKEKLLTNEMDKKKKLFVC